MLEQYGFENLFFSEDGLKLNDKVRLIELFAGIGAQAKALENLGINFEHYKVCEFDKYAITSYNAIHNTNFTTSDIRDLKGSDLEIVDTDTYSYILTYSFPCQDLSLAGNQEGMKEGSNTRSALLWEVKRLLTETEHLPQVLVMENVPQVISKNNLSDFNKWIKFLESLGYSSLYSLQNATSYDIPQNRSRCFMVSWLGDYSYTFPKGTPLKYKLADMLESSVDAKYYLSEKALRGVLNSSFMQKKRQIQTTDICDTILSRDYKDPKCVIENTSPNRLFNIYGEEFGEGYAGNVWDKNAVCPTLTTMQGGNRQPMILEDDSILTLLHNKMVRKLTPKECWRLMGFSDTDFEKARAALNDTFHNGKDKSDSQLYKQAGNSIVVNVLMALFKEMMRKND